MTMKKKIGKILLAAAAALLALVIAAYALLCGRGGAYYDAEGHYAPVDAGNSFHHIMNHPGLEGLGENVLPLGNRLYYKLTSPWKLKIMIPFLGKHEETVVNGLNYAIEAHENGTARFIPFYDSANPAAEETGLLFYKTAEDAPFALVVPGGGFTMLGVASSGYPYAQPLQEAGYNVFILKYRTGIRDGEDGTAAAADRASEDMLAAVDYILQNAQELGVSPDRYLVMGSSAGGQLTARFCAEGRHLALGLPDPRACIMLYPANCQRYDYSRCTVPMYITVCEDDPKIDVAGLDTAVEAMKAAGLTVSYNKFESGGHSFGIGIDTPAEGWMESSLAFAEAYVLAEQPG